MKGILKTSLLAGLLAAVAALALPASGYAAGVGRLAYVSGEVWVERGAVREVAEEGRRLLRNDIVVTGLRGRAKLVMADGSRVYVGARSRIEVAEYVHRGGLLSGMFNMFWGKARFFVNKLVSRNSRFQVRTSTAVLGVRGTSFVVNQAMPAQLPPRMPSFDDFAKSHRLPTRVVLNTGRLQVQLPGGRQMELSAGKTLDVRPDGAVSIRPARAGDENSAPPAPSDSSVSRKGGSQSGQKGSIVPSKGGGQGMTAASSGRNNNSGKGSGLASGGGTAGAGPASSPSAQSAAEGALPPPPLPQAPAGAPTSSVVGSGVAGGAQGATSGSGATAGTAVTNAVQNLGVTTDVTIKPRFVLP